MRCHAGRSLSILLLGCLLVLSTNLQCGEFLLLHYLACPNCCTTQATSQPTACEQTDTPAAQETPSPSCSKGDLNGDGKVDGLDIQVLVNCLLQQ